MTTNPFATNANDRNYSTEFLNFITSIDATIFDFYELIKYSGLDVKLIYKKFFEKEKDKKKAMNDLAKILIFVNERGTRFDKEKVKQRMDPKGMASMQSIITTYGIKLASPTSAEDITFSRLVATFPHILLRIRSELRIKGKLRTVGSVPLRIMEVLCFPGGSSLIPVSSDYDKLFELFFQWADSFDEIIKGSKVDIDTIRPSATSGKKRDPEAVRKYAQTARENNPMGDKERIACLYTVGILTMEGNIVDENVNK